jgi:hypothetical protein
MTVEEIEAIAGGYHGDAFRILGPHSVRKKGGQARWEVRAFLPQAESAEVVAGDERVADGSQAPAGLLLRPLAGDPRRYLIRARLHDGREIESTTPTASAVDLRFRPLPAHRRHAARSLAHAGRAPGRGRRRARRALRGVGAERET